MIKAVVPAPVRRWPRARWAELREASDYFRIRRKFGDFSLGADLAAALRCWQRRGKTILCYPEHPDSESTVYRLFALLGFAFTTNPRHRFDVAFKHKNITRSDPAVLDQVPTARDRIINAGTWDISKRTVNRVFEEVFGYPLKVDPTRYAGRIVEKSDHNAAHDGRVIQGPIPADAVKDGCVYQKEIESICGKSGSLTEWRVPIHGGRIPLVYTKYKSAEHQFVSKHLDVALTETDDAFSATEQADLLRLAEAMGIDFAEFDVLRDKDGRIYVVDINTTPWGPPNYMDPQLAATAMMRLSASFMQLMKTKM